MDATAPQRSGSHAGKNTPRIPRHKDEEEPPRSGRSSSRHARSRQEGPRKPRSSRPPPTNSNARTRGVSRHPEDKQYAAGTSFEPRDMGARVPQSDRSASRHARRDMPRRPRNRGEEEPQQSDRSASRHERPHRQEYMTSGYFPPPSTDPNRCIYGEPGYPTQGPGAHDMWEPAPLYAHGQFYHPGQENAGYGNLPGYPPPY
jgi:hypothetical protein